MKFSTRPHVISEKLDEVFGGLTHAMLFIGQYFRQLFNGPFEWREFIKQCYNIGVRSLLLITLTGFVTGIVFTKQSRPSLIEFGAASWLPSLIAIAVVRALAPLVTALICSGKIGSNIGAELGSMRVTEQIDAMEVSGTNPFKFLVVTRVSATTVMIPVLMMYFGFVALMGSFLNVHQNEATSFVTFFQDAFSPITFLDIFTGLFKAIFYGFTIGLVGCYSGYHAEKGTEGVGMAANRAVIISMFLVFIEEIVIVQISNWIRLA